MQNDLKTLTKTEGNYHLNIKPWLKPWNEAEKFEVSFTLDLNDEKKTFKGLIDLVGIICKGTE